MKRIVTLLVLSTMVLGTGCGKKTDKMGRTRPPVDELSDGGRGLQGKDVINASNEMAASLLSNPKINSSATSVTIVVDRVQNLSVSQRQNLDIFLSRLRSLLVQKSNGRIQIIENKATFHDLRNRELDTPSDRFGQGGTAGPAVAAVQPDYFLSAKLAEMPNRETSYFLMEFTLTGVDRTIPWSGFYEVAVVQR